MDLVKQRIILKSLDLFNTVGVKVVTMDMISEELGMSKKTLYEHFASKEELIKQTFNEHITSSVTLLEEDLDKDTSAIQKYILFQNRLRDNFFIKDKTLYQLSKFYPQIAQEILESQEDFIKLYIKNIINQGIDEGLYRAKLNIDIAVEYLFLVEKSFTANNRLEKKENNAQNEDYFSELLIRSIASKRGVKELDRIMGSEL